ncbi:MAG: histidine phosphatase family protein [Nanoarchaeota archaeon]
MKLIIVRHGETFANEKGISCGWHNSRLNKVGLEQAKKLAYRLSNEKIDIIFCSDLMRCRQTIKPYLEKVKKEINYTKLLRERGITEFLKVNL